MIISVLLTANNYSFRDLLAYGVFVLMVENTKLTVI